ncbi:MAG: NUDIX domain-containing protein [Gemmatimonadetes bacterium]|nr:NUDIX domain-containing protein [Gemmatimonadota bacterium]
MLSVRQLHDIITAFDPGEDVPAQTSRERTLDLLAQAERALDRRNYSPGHVTASAIVLSTERSHVLLVFHRRLRRWVQPGGHIEPDDADASEAAAREVCEETGVQPRWEVDPALVGVHVHDIPASGREPAHLHYDIVWRFVAPAARNGSLLGPDRAFWCRIQDLDHYGADVALVRAVERALRVR